VYDQSPHQISRPELHCRKPHTRHIVTILSIKMLQQ